MRLVISDTGPVNYLILIGHIDILPALFKTVILPTEVLNELSDPGTPPGTVGVLDQAAKHGLLDLADAFDRLRQTSFHRPEAIMARLQAEHEKRDRKA